MQHFKIDTSRESLKQPPTSIELKNNCSLKRPVVLLPVYISTSIVQDNVYLHNLTSDIKPHAHTDPMNIHRSSLQAEHLLQHVYITDHMPITDRNHYVAIPSVTWNTKSANDLSVKDTGSHYSLV